MARRIAWATAINLQLQVLLKYSFNHFQDLSEEAESRNLGRNIFLSQNLIRTFGLSFGDVVRVELISPKSVLQHRGRLNVSVDSVDRVSN